jgi:hypothetical protein
MALRLMRASEPRLKLFHSMAARLLLWFTFSVLPLLLRLALPPTTLPPDGKVLAAGVVQALTRVWLTRHAVTQGAR